MSPAAFPDEVVAAVCDHMNHDHPEDCLLIVQGLAGRTEATSARMVSFDRQAADFVAVTPVGELAARVPFSEPVHERAQIRCRGRAHVPRGVRRHGPAAAPGRGALR